MKAILVFVGSILFSSISFAGDAMDALAGKYPLGGILSKGENYTDFIFMPDFFSHGYSVPTKEEFGAIVSDYSSIANMRAKKLAEIRARATILSVQYPPNLWTQGVTYQTALSAVIATAMKELESLSDIAMIKRYQPTWPPAPKN